MKGAFTIRGLHHELTAAGFSDVNDINFSSNFFQNKSHFFYNVTIGLFRHQRWNYYWAPSA